MFRSEKSGLFVAALESKVVSDFSMGGGAWGEAEEGVPFLTMELINGQSGFWRQ